MYFKQCMPEPYMKLYNGKELKEALKELQEFKEYTKEIEGNSFYGIEEYYERMQSVFGSDGYRVSYSDMGHMVLPSGQVVLSCKGHIDILTENGGVAFSTEGYGTYEVSLAKSGTRFNFLDNAGMSLNVNAFKAACREMNIFACRDVDVVRARAGKKRYSNQAGNNQNSSPNQDKKSTGRQTISAPVKTMHFFLTKPLKEFWRDRNQKPAYRMVAQELREGQKSDTEYEILFYPNQYQKYADKLEELVKRSANTAGFRITLGVSDVASEKQNKDYAGSYVFKRFGEGA